MQLPREKREERTVVQPPPEAVQRVSGGGAWGPTQFELPERSGNDSQAIWIVALVGVVILLITAGLWAVAYFELV